MKHRLLRYADIVIFGLLVTLCLYEGLSLIQGQLRFTADSERDLFQVFALSHHGRLPDSGILMAALGWDLGPLYFLFLAPFNAIWPSPQTVHTVNILLFVGGLTAAYVYLRSAWGIAAALIFTLLYSQSAAHIAMTSTIWHVGAAPGFALATFAAAGWWARSARPIALYLAAGLLSALVQIHALAMAYVPAAMMLLWVYRSRLNKRSIAIASTTIVVVLLPLLWYLVPSLASTGGSAARHSGGLGFNLGALWSSLSALLQPRYVLSAVWGGMATQMLTMTGIAVTVLLFVRGKRPWFRAFLVLQLLIGSAIVASVINYESVGRYFLPIIYPLYFLAAIGVADLNSVLRARGRPVVGRAVVFGVVVLGLMTIQPPTVDVWAAITQPNNAQQTDSRRDYLNAKEQDAVVRYFVEEKGLNWSQLRTRVHGAFTGPLTGIRYMERIHRPERTKAQTIDRMDHWHVLPPNTPLPEGSSQEGSTVIHVDGRPLHIMRYKPGFDAAKVQGEKGPCPWIFPYLWSEQKTEVLKLVGFPLGHGPDIHSCFNSSAKGTLILPLGESSTDITVQISDEGHFAGKTQSPIKAFLRTPGFKDFPLAPSRDFNGVEKRWITFSIPPHDSERELHLEITPQGNLAYLDIF